MILNSFDTSLQRFGLGNFIQGSYGLYELSRKLNLDFAIDFSEHPMGDYIDHSFDINDKKKTRVYDISFRRNIEQTADYIKKLYSIYTKNGYDSVRFYYNEPPTSLSIVIDYSLSKFFSPNKDTVDLIEKQFSHKFYDVIHIRCGDHNVFNQSGFNIDTVLAKISGQIVSIRNQSSLPILIISDSYELKSKLAAIYDLVYIDTQPSHSIDYDDFFYEVALDFFLITRAQNVHNFCSYMRPSSFSYWACALNKTPFYFYDTLSTFRE